MRWPAAALGEVVLTEELRLPVRRDLVEATLAEPVLVEAAFVEAARGEPALAEEVWDCLRVGTNPGACLCVRVTGVACAEATAKVASVRTRHTFRMVMEVCGESQSFLSVTK